MNSLKLLGRLANASNGTFLVLDEDDIYWVYKPVAGEMPLVDFPSGTLGRREVAAYDLSEELGLGIVPKTVWCDGPLGEGSLQLWVEGRPTSLVDLVPLEGLTEDWLPVMDAETSEGVPVVLAHRDENELRRMALFDVLLNNADRKASHLIDAEARVWGVDHGLSLHADHKLRTVLWGWAGTPLTDDDQILLTHAASVDVALSPGLADSEWVALSARAKALLARGVFPAPAGTWRDIPWPPW